MSESQINQELDAIKTVTEALQPLEKDTRQRVLDYATRLLGLPTSNPAAATQLTSQPSGPGAGTSAAHNPSAPPSDAIQPPTDIRSLKEQKRPATDTEMATLVAYYLKHEAPEDERKIEIGTDDIDTYFVQANYPLPKNKAYTLPNAKKAGYLASSGRGKYKLNSVGHNLVAHNMPRSDNGNVLNPERKKKTSQKSKKKAQKATKKRSR